ncbi:MAG TPA: hypothetical protein VHN98_04505 [Acidimicrobiales bacterium]|nr:hypothetical protein [Acidimicrobiales bacterium]
MPSTAVLFGGPSPEHDVSILTGLTSARALADAGHQVEAVYWSKAGEFSAVDPTLEATAFVDGVPRGARELQLQAGAGGGFVSEGRGLGRKRSVLELDAVVNCCHGGPGEDGTLQAALDLAGIRYTGPSVAGAALGMDKLAFAAVVEAAGLPHLPVVALDAGGDAPFDGPYIVKPRFGGSSIGIEVFEDWDSVVAFARSPQPHLRSGGVVEPYRAGAVDLEIGIRRHPELQLSPISKPASKGAIFDYREKYVPGEGMAAAPRETPASLPDGAADTIRGAARRVADLALVRGVARLDFLLIDDQVVVNEINTIPGSLTKHLWVDPPIPFATLLADMIAEATRGPGRAYSTQGADGSILRSATSIASKLG